MIIKEENLILEEVEEQKPKRKRGRQPKIKHDSIISNENENLNQNYNKNKIKSTTKYLSQFQKQKKHHHNYSEDGLVIDKKKYTDPLRPWLDSCLYLITPQTFYNQRDDNDWEFFKPASSSPSSLPETSSDPLYHRYQKIITDERIHVAIHLMVKQHDETCCICLVSYPNSSSNSVNTITGKNENSIIPIIGSKTLLKDEFTLSKIRGTINDKKENENFNFKDNNTIIQNDSDEVQILSPLWNIDTAFLLPLSTSTSSFSKTGKTGSSNSNEEKILESCPSDIYATYSYDLNIIKIHEAIRAKFTGELRSIHRLKTEAENLRKRQGQKCGGFTIVERKECGRLAKELEEKILKIESHQEWLSYIEKAKPLLEKYVKVASEEALGIVVIGLGVKIEAGVKDQRYSSISSSFKETPLLSHNSDKLSSDPYFSNIIPPPSLNTLEDETDKKERLLIIEEYLKVASKYINIHVIPIQTETIRCPICYRRQDDISVANSGAFGGISDDHGTSVCECGRETICVARSATFRDSARIDTGIKNSYEDLANFIKRLDAFEGKQRSPPPTCLYDQLENFFVSKPLECGLSPEQIRNLPIDENGKKKGTSIPLLEEALLRTNNSAFYKDVELIAHKFWGWKIADISSSGLRRTLIADYIATQKVYDTIKERESSLNVNLRLYFHLKARDYPCELSDFKIVSSRDSLEYHSRMFEIMCERTGLKFTPII